MIDPFLDENDTTNPLPFPTSPRLGWDDNDDQDPIAAYYLHTLNREIRALKSDYDLASCCHTYLKMAVLSLRLYIPVWEGLLGEVLEGESDFGSDTDSEVEGEEGVHGLDGYRQVLEMMDMRAYSTHSLVFRGPVYDLHGS